MYRVLLACCFLLAIGSPARSQFTQFVQPGSGTIVPEDSAENAAKAAGSARWRWGRLRVEPHLTLNNVGYFENVFAAPDETSLVDDYRARAGAGLAGYLRLGGKSLVAAFLATEYSWWREAEDLRELGLNSGLAWFGSFNRLKFSASARSTERERPLSFEVEAPVQISAENLNFDTTLELTRRLAIFGVASNTETRHATEAEQFVPGLALDTLDRDASRKAVGLELRGSDFEFGLGYEETEVDFVSSDNRDNTGEGPLFRLSYNRRRLTARVTYSDLEFDYVDPELPSTRQTTGTALVLVRIRPDTTVGAHAAEGLAFTTISSTGIIETEGLGFSLRQNLSQRLEASAFIDSGTQSFVDIQNPGRVDDYEAIGLGFRLKVNDGFALTGQLREESWDSTFSEFDRSSSGLSLGLEVGGDLLPF